MYHGNVYVTSIDADFVLSNDYGVLTNAAATFPRLMGEGEKMKEFAVREFHEARLWLREEAEHDVSKQRYKGLGEMNPE